MDWGTFWTWAAKIVGVLLACYVVPRLVTSAIFTGYWETKKIYCKS
jgi:hypothetical protein